MSTLRSHPARVVSPALALLLIIVLAACGGSDNVVADGALSKDKGVPTIPVAPIVTTTTLADAKGKPCMPATDIPPGPNKPTVEMPEGTPPTELVKTDLTVGTGAEATASDTITVNYIGISCSTGKQFDSSWDEGRTPYNTSLANVIPGWQQGVPGMKVGGRRMLVIPPDLGYGADGNSGIGPNETLVFVVDLVGIGAATTTTTPAAPTTAPVTTTAPAAAATSTTVG